MEQQEQPRWRPTRTQALWTVGIVAALIVSVLIGYRYGITLWDWIKLLIVPVVIAGGGFWFNRQQREREIGIAREQREREVEIAERRTQDEALQAYLDQMSDMLIPIKDQPSLYKARLGDSLSSVARARTLTVLLRLDGERKARVIQFLYESGLIAKNHPILYLRGADLNLAVLSRADLRFANLRFADLSSADLSSADLSQADLTRPELRRPERDQGHHGRQPERGRELGRYHHVCRPDPQECRRPRRTHLRRLDQGQQGPRGGRAERISKARAVLCTLSPHARQIYT
jgi:hypothetical protein